MRIEIQSSNKGIALVIVMLVILVLATLAGAFAYSMKIEVTLARNANYESQLEWLGRSGIELARYTLAEQAKIPNEGNYEALNQIWAGGTGGVGGSNSALSSISLENVPLGDGVINKITITDLERKFNINTANRSMLLQAMTIMGVDASVASEIADAILDWIDQDDDPHLSGAESDYYLSLDPPYVAKNGPMDDISELLLLKGIYENPEIYWGTMSTNYVVPAVQARNSNRPFDDPHRPSYPIGLVDIFTTLSNGKINANTASAMALRMLMDEDLAFSTVQDRAGFDGVEGTDDDIPYPTVEALRRVPGMPQEIVDQARPFCGGRSSTFEVEVDVEINGVKRLYYGIIRRGSRPDDFAILKFYWK